MNPVSENKNKPVGFPTSKLAHRRSAFQKQRNSQTNVLNQPKPEISGLIPTKLSRFKKLFIFIACLTCIMLFSWQFYTCIQRYFRYPLSTVTTRKENKLPSLPSITICNNYLRFNAAIRSNEVGKADITDYKDMEHVWTTYGVNSSHLQINRTCNPNSSEPSGPDVSVTTLYSILGKCVDVTLHCPLKQKTRGMDLSLKREPVIYYLPNFTKFDGPNYNMYAHAHSELYVHNLYENIEWTWTKVEFSFFFQTTEYYYLNSPRNPCVPLQEHINCIDKCIITAFEANAKCKIPPMKSANLPICTSWFEVTEVLNKYRDWKIVQDIFDNCSCTRVCQKTEFKVQYIHTRPSTNDFARALIRVEDTMDYVVEEFYAYPFSILISDMSGIIGFFLGMSLFGIFELLEKFLARFVIIRKKPSR